MRHFLKTIESTSEWVGKSASWIVLALMGVMVVATMLRYAFNKAPAWGYDLTWMLYAAYFLLGGAYCLLHEGHVRVDFLSERLPPRARSILEIVCYVVFFLPLFYMLVRGGIDYAVYSWVTGERSPFAHIWAPPIGPIKTVMVIGFLLLAFQGLAYFIKHVFAATRGKLP